MVLVLGSLFVPLQEEGGKCCPAHLMPHILPANPPTRHPLPLLPHPSLSPFLGPKAISSSVRGLILCPAPGPHFSLGLYLAAITAHSGQPG